jgi:hypothetical protein
MRDSATDHVGSVELPVAAVAKLPPFVVPLPAAAPQPK